MRTNLLRYGIIGVCVLFCILGAVSLNDLLIYTPDSARYLTWAGSLAKFEGFKDATGPEPVRYVVHAPLYPLLITPAAWIAPGSVIAAKVVTLLLGVLVLWMFFRWLKGSVGEGYALAGAAVLALHPLMLVYSTQVLSDVPFALCVIAFFLLAERLETEPKSHGIPEAGLVGVIVAGIFLREVGLTLMLGATAYFAFRKQYQRAALIFLAAVLFYLLWFVRNEVIVAPLENPPMRNTRVFFTHFYTSQNTNLLVELGTRLWSNITIYGKLIGRLLLYPDYGARSLSVISLSDPLVAFVTKLLPIGQYVLATVTLIIGAVGVWTAARTWKAFPIAAMFLVFYFGPILFYPINDIRFMFPVMLLLILFVLMGMKRLAGVLTKASLRPVLFGVAAILLLPNLIWVQSFVRNSAAYRASPATFLDRFAGEPTYPEMFSKPLPLAGKWIAEHSDPSAVVLTRWKELALWLDGRKVVDEDPETTVDVFDTELRNYDIQYLVTVVSRGGLREHEVLCARSAKFDFETVYRVGNVEVLRVHPRQGNPVVASTPTTRQDSVRADFASALKLLNAGRPAEAESLLTAVRGRIGPYGNIVFHIAVAKEFAGHLEEAAKLFADFRYVPQAGSYIQQAWYHLEMIARLRAAEAARNLEDRANRFYVLAVNYWEVGFRGQALRTLSRAIEADPTFYPAIIFASIFRYKNGDAVSARRLLEQARSFAPTNVLTLSLGDILLIGDSLNTARDTKRVVALRYRRALALISMGIRDDAVDDLRVVIALDPTNREALRRLGDLYYYKQHEAPALAVFSKLESLGGLDEEGKARLAELRRRWE